MTAYTDPDRLPYPDDTSAPADSPTALEELATATQVALSERITEDEAASLAGSITDGRLAARTVATGTGLTGGGDLSANRTLAVDTSTIATRSYAAGRVWMGTQSAYDQIGTKDPTVLYVITG